MSELQLGDRVMHDFSKVHGIVTGKRLAEPYRYRVLWDGDGLKEDWYQREVLVEVVGTVDEILYGYATEFHELVERPKRTNQIDFYNALSRAKAALSALIEEKLNAVTRFEVIDHRECVYCRGCSVANYAQKDGTYKEQPCDKCDGSGMRGGRAYVANSNAETSMIDVRLSYQDDGKTLKVFVNDKQQQPKEEKGSN